MKYIDRIQLSAQPIETSKKPGKPYVKEYHKFISSSIVSLNRGYRVTVFTQEQVKELQNYFGDVLEVYTYPGYYILHLKESEVKR